MFKKFHSLHLPITAQNAKRRGTEGDGDVLGAALGLAVDVEGSRGGAADGQTGGLEGLDAGVLVEAVAEDLDGHRQGVERLDGVDDRDVDQAVREGSLWCDVESVAPLVGVGACDSERGAAEHALFGLDEVLLRGIVKPVFDCLPDVCDQSPGRLFGVFFADEGVISDSCGTEARGPVDCKGVYPSDLALVQDLDGLARVHRDVQVTGEAVAGAARDDAEDGVGADKGAGDFVDRAVAADSHDELLTRLHSLRCEGCGMPGSRCETDCDFVSVHIDRACDRSDYGFFRRAARDRVDDECGFHPNIFSQNDFFFGGMVPRYS